MKVVFSKDAESQIPDDGDAIILGMRMYQILSVFHDCETASGWDCTFTNSRTDRSVPAEVVNANGALRAWWRKRGLPMSRYVEVHRIEFTPTRKENP